MVGVVFGSWVFSVFVCVLKKSTGPASADWRFIRFVLQEQEQGCSAFGSIVSPFALSFLSVCSFVLSVGRIQGRQEVRRHRFSQSSGHYE